MIDRGIGILGLALAVIAWALPLAVPSIPMWALITALTVGIFLVGLSFGLIVSAQRTKSNKPLSPVATARLRLHIYGDMRAPDRIDAEHIFRWYFLRMQTSVISLADQQRHDASVETLFVSFDPEVKISTLSIQSPDIVLPSYETKDFNQRYAIIAFAGHIEAGTLEVAVHP